MHISIDIQSTSESQRILRSPAAHLGVIVARSAPHQSGIGIVNPASKSKRLKSRRSITQNLSELVVVELLRYCARRNIHNQSWTTELVRDNAVCRSGLGHVGRNVAS